MKAAAIVTVAILSAGLILWGHAASRELPHRIGVSPEIKKAFPDGDSIAIHAVTGSAPRFEVGGTYRVVGTCRQGTLKKATLYLGNTSEQGGPSIAADAGSSLSVAVEPGATDFDITFTLLRPGLLHVTLYDPNRASPTDNAHAGIYLGDAVFRR